METTKKQSQVQEQLDLLEKAVGLYEDKVEVLENCLAGVLQFTNKAEPESEPKEGFVSLAGSLNNLTLSMARHTARLQSIISRLEL